MLIQRRRDDASADLLLAPAALLSVAEEATQRVCVAALSQYEEDCLTLQAQRGDTVLAFFRHPKGLRLRSSALRLAPGVSVLANGESCQIPPSGSIWLNPWVEIEAVPHWLRELAFEGPNDSPGEAISVRTLPARPTPCRSARHFEKQHRCVRSGCPSFNQDGRERGFRRSRRR